MRRKIIVTTSFLIFTLLLSSCSKDSVDRNPASNLPKSNASTSSNESLTMQSELSFEEQKRQDELLKSGVPEIKETLIPNVYADITVKPAITAGDIAIGKNNTALIMIKANSAGKFELEGYFARDFSKEEYISVAVPMEKQGSFKVWFTPTNGDQINIATLIVK